MESEEDAGWTEVLKKASLQMGEKYSKTAVTLKAEGKMDGATAKENM